MYKAIRNVLLIGCLLILFAAYARFRYVEDVSQRETVLVQDSTVVERGDIILTVSASGPIRANQELPLVFLATGRIDTVNVEEGQHVLKGQTLATLDTRNQQAALTNAQLALDGARVTLKAFTAAPRDVDLQSAIAALNVAQANVKAAGVGGYDLIRVKLAQLQVEIAKNREWQAQLQRDQAVSLSGATFTLPASIQDAINQLPENARNQINGFINQINQNQQAFLPSASDAEINIRSSAFDTQIAQSGVTQAQSARGDQVSLAQAQAAVSQAQAALEKLRAGPDDKTIAIAKAQVDASQVAVDLAQYALSRSTLVAPFDGMVTALNLTVGESAPVDRPALTLVDDSGFYVDIGIDELDIARIAPGQKVSFVFDALPGQVITGRVDRVASASVALAGVVTYPVHILLDPNPALRAGLSTTATITVDQITNTLRVRNRFVKLDRKTGQASVTVRTADGQFKDVNVVLGLRNETWSEVKAGLAEGDTVVVLPRDTNLLSF
jgi:RND family efflux transporter MFP subunit